MSLASTHCDDQFLSMLPCPFKLPILQVLDKEEVDEEDAEAEAEAAGLDDEDMEAFIEGDEDEDEEEDEEVRIRIVQVLHRIRSSQIVNFTVASMSVCVRTCACVRA